MNRKQGYVQTDDDLNKYLDNMKRNAADRGIRLLYCVASSPWVGTVTRACGTTNDREAEDCVGCMLTDLIATCGITNLLTHMSVTLLNQGQTKASGTLLAAAEFLEDNPPAEGGDQ